MKQTLIMLIGILLCSCNGGSQEKTMNNTLINSPEYKTFMSQEHRFEINECELKYNGKAFKLGMSLEELESVFGKDYKSEENNVVKWDKGVILIGWKGVDNLISEMRVVFNESQLSIFAYGDTINSKDNFEDFIKSSKLSFEDFFIHDQGYRLTKENCSYSLDFDSPVPYNRKGGGHLSIKGDWKLDETNPVKSISIYK